MRQRAATDQRTPMPALWPSEDLAAARQALLCAVPLDGVDPHRLPFDEVALPWTGLERALRFAAPAVVTLPGQAGGYFVIVRRCRPAAFLLAYPGGATRRFPAHHLANLLRSAATSAVDHHIDGLLQRPPLLALRAAARRRLQGALLQALLEAEPSPVAHLLTSPAGRGLPAGNRLAGRLADLSAARPPIPLAIAWTTGVAVEETAALAAWAILANALLTGRLDAAAATAWALLIVSAPLLHALHSAAASSLGRSLALGLRHRLFTGILATTQRSPLLEGTGTRLARVLAAEDGERSLLLAAQTGTLAFLQLLAAAAAATHGAAPVALNVLLLAFLTASLRLALHLDHRAAQTSSTERRLTGQLVEHLAGHRTLRVQGHPASPLADSALAAHHRGLGRLARSEVSLTVSLPHCWTVTALTALAVLAVLAGLKPDARLAASRLALSCGAILLAHTGLARLGATAMHLTSLRAAWREVRPLLTTELPIANPPDLQPTASNPAPTDPPATNQPGLNPPPTQPAPHLLEAHHLALPAPPNTDLSFAIRTGEHVLLTGPSGAGKSTLAAILAGQTPPPCGLLLLDGYDQPTLGRTAWRRRVVLVPQLHTDHIFAGTLAWNLLLDRAWPPTPADLAEARTVCTDLGLDDLLDRMPCGLEQRVGEASWQLSGGETARICLARALLRQPDLLVLDESLGALDPSLRLQALRVIERRARTVLLIAHTETD